MKKFIYLSLLFLAGFLMNFRFAAAQDMEEWEWKTYKTKFSVPAGFTVTKNTDTEFEGKAGRLNLSIEAEKDEKITDANAEAFGQALGEELVKYAQKEGMTFTEKDIHTFELNGYVCIGVDAKGKSGDPILLAVLIDPDYTEIRLYIQVDYKGSTETVAENILKSFKPD